MKHRDKMQSRFRFDREKREFHSALAGAIINTTKQTTAKHTENVIHTSGQKSYGHLHSTVFLLPIANPTEKGYNLVSSVFNYYSGEIVSTPK